MNPPTAHLDTDPPPKDKAKEKPYQASLVHETPEPPIRIPDFLISLLVTFVFLIVLWLGFDSCKLCVVTIFLVSACCCIRFPILQVAFWPALIILYFNMHLLRDIHITADIPVGETLDDIFGSRITENTQSTQNAQNAQTSQNTLQTFLGGSDGGGAQQSSTPLNFNHAFDHIKIGAQHFPITR